MTSSNPTAVCDKLASIASIGAKLCGKCSDVLRFHDTEPAWCATLSSPLDTIIKVSGQVVYVPGSSPSVSRTVTGVHLIKLGDFRQMVRKDGLGEIIWNECGKGAYVTIVVQDERLVADFLRCVGSD